MSLQQLDLMWIKKYKPSSQNQVQIDKINHRLVRNQKLHNIIAAEIIENSYHSNHLTTEKVTRNLMVEFAEGSQVLSVSDFLEKYSNDVNEAMITYVQAKLDEEHQVAKAFKVHYSVANRSKYTMASLIRNDLFANHKVKQTTFEEYITQREQEKHEYFGYRFRRRSEDYTKDSKISKVTKINSIIREQLVAWRQDSEHKSKPDLDWVRELPYYQENQHVFEDGRTGEILRSEYWLDGVVADEKSEASPRNYSN